MDERIALQSEELRIELFDLNEHYHDVVRLCSDQLMIDDDVLNPFILDRVNGFHCVVAASIYDAKRELKLLVEAEDVDAYSFFEDRKLWADADIIGFALAWPHPNCVPYPDSVWQIGFLCVESRFDQQQVAGRLIQAIGDCVNPHLRPEHRATLIGIAPNIDTKNTVERDTHTPTATVTTLPRQRGSTLTVETTRRRVGSRSTRRTRISGTHTGTITATPVCELEAIATSPIQTTVVPLAGTGSPKNQLSASVTATSTVPMATTTRTSTTVPTPMPSMPTTTKLRTATSSTLTTPMFPMTKLKALQTTSSFTVLTKTTPDFGAMARNTGTATKTLETLLESSSTPKGMKKSPSVPTLTSTARSPSDKSMKDKEKVWKWKSEWERGRVLTLSATTTTKADTRQRKSSEMTALSNTQLSSDLDYASGSHSMPRNPVIRTAVDSVVRATLLPRDGHSRKSRQPTTKGLSIYAPVWHRKAQKLYESMGFVKIARIGNYYSTDEALITRICSLPPTTTTSARSSTRSHQTQLSLSSVSMDSSRVHSSRRLDAFMFCKGDLSHMRLLLGLEYFSFKTWPTLGAAIGPMSVITRMRAASKSKSKRSTGSSLKPEAAVATADKGAVDAMVADGSSGVDFAKGPFKMTGAKSPPKIVEQYLESRISEKGRREKKAKLREKEKRRKREREKRSREKERQREREGERRRREAARGSHHYFAPPPTDRRSVSLARDYETTAEYVPFYQFLQSRPFAEGVHGGGGFHHTAVRGHYHSGEMHYLGAARHSAAGGYFDEANYAGGVLLGSGCHRHSTITGSAATMATSSRAIVTSRSRHESGDTLHFQSTTTAADRSPHLTVRSGVVASSKSGSIGSDELALDLPRTTSLARNGSGSTELILVQLSGGMVAGSRRLSGSPKHAVSGGMHFAGTRTLPHSAPVHFEAGTIATHGRVHAHYAEVPTVSAAEGGHYYVGQTASLASAPAHSYAPMATSPEYLSADATRDDATGDVHFTARYKEEYF